MGDIIVNLGKIKNRKKLKKFKLEFDTLWIHGLMHLLGHDHLREKDFQKMTNVERKYLNLIKN